MKNGYSQLIQSKYFVTDFNSAIFDGPIRIYFTQTQESLALKVYFHIQNHFSNEVRRLKDISPDGPSSLFILIYPNQESFAKCFDGNDPMVVVNWDSDIVMGINEVHEGIDFSMFDSQFRAAYAQWLEQNKKQRHEEITL